jgi:tripartite-type tricarboxylate transporter receptor subunit TctC
MHVLARTTFSILIAAGVASALPALAQTKQAYPTKPIRIVSGFPPGGVNDIIARTVSVKLSESLSTPVIVENRPGAAGVVAANSVARAEPNGYTVMIYSSGFAINAAIQESLPYDPLKDFTGVAQLGPITQGLIVSPSLGVKTVKDLVALAKVQEGKIILGSSGAGSGSHLIGEIFRLAAGIKVVHVGFKGNADMLIQIAGGRVHYGISAIGPAMPLYKDGKLLILGVTTSKRSTVLPDVPAIGESLPNFKYQGGFGLLAPAKTPRDIVNLLNKEIAKILALPDAREQLLTAGIFPTVSTPEQFDKIVREEIATFTRVVREIGLRK